jgi:hypothetical protein
MVCRLKKLSREEGEGGEGKGFYLRLLRVLRATQKHFIKTMPPPNFSAGEFSAVGAAYL